MQNRKGELVVEAQPNTLQDTSAMAPFLITKKVQKMTSDDLHFLAHKSLGGLLSLCALCLYFFVTVVGQGRTMRFYEAQLCQAPAQEPKSSRCSFAMMS